MLKKILVFISVFYCFGILGAFNNKTMSVEELHIFSILQNAKAILMEDILQKNIVAADVSGLSVSTEDSEKIDAIEKASLAVVEKEITLLREIVDGLNNNSLIFEFRFIAVCNFFSNMDLIEPRNVRAFERKLIRFDNSVQKYSKNKRGLMSVQEAKLCKKIMEFDKILLACFLRHDFYNIDLYDEIVDTCFFRPVEFMGDHPVLTMSAVLVVLSVAFYLYGYPLMKARAIRETYDAEGDETDELDEKPVSLLVNKNSNVDVDQVERVRQQGLECAANAVFGIIAKHEGNGDVSIVHKLINDRARFKKLRAHWATLPDIVKDGKSNLSNLDTNHVMAIIADYNSMAERPIPPENLIVIQDSNELKSDIFEDFNIMEIINDGTYPNDIPGGEPFVKRQGKRSRLMHGEPIYVIVNTAQDDVSGLSYEKPMTEKPVTDKSTIEKPVVNKPATNKAATEKSATGWFAQWCKTLFGVTRESEDKSPDKSSKSNPRKKPYDSGWLKTRDGHWFSMMFLRDESAKNGVRVIVSDSWYNSNQTNSWHLNRMHHILLNGS